MTPSHLALLGGQDMGKSKSRNRSEERDPLGSLTDPVVAPLPHNPVLAHQLQEIADARVLPPEVTQTMPAVDLFGTPAPITITQPVPSRPGLKRQAPKVMFANPGETVVCVRRQARKEVLFAKKRTGRGARSKKHFNRHSRTHCK